MQELHPAIYQGRQQTRGCIRPVPCAMERESSAPVPASLILHLSVAVVSYFSTLLFTEMIRQISHWPLTLTHTYVYVYTRTQMYLYLYLHITTKESNLKESPPAARSFPRYRKLLYFETCVLFQAY